MSRFAAPDTNYEKLRAAIVRGEIAPNSRLVESDVVMSFHMTRAAVRNALIRLEQEGLVVREPHRGARVRQVTDVEAATTRPYYGPFPANSSVCSPK